jgi:hypothetical protein
VKSAGSLALRTSFENVGFGFYVIKIPKYTSDFLVQSKKNSCIEEQEILIPKPI